MNSFKNNLPKYFKESTEADELKKFKEYKKLISDIKNQIIVFSFRNSSSVSKKPNDYSYLKINKQNYIYDVSEKRKISTKPHFTAFFVSSIIWLLGVYWLTSIKLDLKFFSQKF